MKQGKVLLHLFKKLEVSTTLGIIIVRYNNRIKEHLEIFLPMLTANMNLEKKKVMFLCYYLFNSYMNAFILHYILIIYLLWQRNIIKVLLKYILKAKLIIIICKGNGKKVQGIFKSTLCLTFMFILILNCTMLIFSCLCFY